MRCAIRPGELSTILDIPAYQQAAFRQGHEGTEIWDWLERRRELHRLPDALRSIDRTDLATLVSTASNLRPEPVHPGHRAPRRANWRSPTFGAVALIVATGSVAIAISTRIFNGSQNNGEQPSPSTSVANALTIVAPPEGRVPDVWHAVKVRPAPPDGHKLFVMVRAKNDATWHLVRCPGQGVDAVECKGVAIGDVNSTGSFEVMVVTVTAERAGQLAPPNVADPTFTGDLQEIGYLEQSRVYTYTR